MYYLAISTGIIGSLHCVGMCAPIALAVPSRTLPQRITYQIGRLLTYTLLGSLAGLVGYGLVAAGFQQKIALFTGGLLIVYAILPFLFGKQSLSSEWVLFKYLKPYFSRFFSQRSLTASLMIGILNGFLPCGLVYTALLSAATMASFPESALYMAVFGLGTVPMLGAIVFFKHRFTLFLKPQIRYILPTATFILGVLMILRGLNLGIPYISPKLEIETQTMSCCSKRTK